MAGKRFLGKVTSKLCIYPAGKKFRRNRSISHRQGWGKCTLYLSTSLKVQCT